MFVGLRSSVFFYSPLGHEFHHMNILFGKKKTGKTEYASVNEVWIKLLDGWQVMWVLKKEQAFRKDQYLTKSVKEQALYKRYYVFCGELLLQGEGTATYGLYRYVL